MDLHENPQDSGMKKRKPEQVPSYNNSPKKDSFSFFIFILFGIWCNCLYHSCLFLLWSWVKFVFLWAYDLVRLVSPLWILTFFLDRWNFTSSPFFVFFLMKYVFLYPLFFFRSPGLIFYGFTFRVMPHQVCWSVVGVQPDNRNVAIEFYSEIN